MSALPDPQEGSDPMGHDSIGSPQGTPPVDADGYVIGPYGDKGRTHCIHGHPFTVENTYMDRSQTPATRKCRTCRRENKRKARHQRHGW